MIVVLKICFPEKITIQLLLLLICCSPVHQSHFETEQENDEATTAHRHSAWVASIHLFLGDSEIIHSFALLAVNIVVKFVPFNRHDGV